MGLPYMHPSWKLTGSWPVSQDQVVLGIALARRMHQVLNYPIVYETGLTKDYTQGFVSGFVDTGGEEDNEVFLPLEAAQAFAHLPNAISRVEISARSRPEDAFARQDPDKMSPSKRDLWYCRPYANSIAYQIQEAIPGSRAEQVRRVEQTEGTVLERISGLMWLISGAALLAAGFAVSAAMATAVLERRGEIGLMRSLGASKAAIATLFYAESGLLAVIAGTVGYFAGSVLAWWLGRRIFSGDGTTPVLDLVLLPIVVALALAVAIAGATPSIRSALNTDPSSTLRGGA